MQLATASYMRVNACWYKATFQLHNKYTWNLEANIDFLKMEGFSSLSPAFDAYVGNKTYLRPGIINAT